MNRKFKYHRDGTTPTNGEIFTFGSNLNGYHRGGAAKEAHVNYGAIYGKALGLYGQSYAIPTKDDFISSLSLDEIQKYVTVFTDFTYEHSELEFFVTRIGCFLAGYKDADIAPLFKGCNTNCSFANQWAYYLED